MQIQPKPYRLPGKEWKCPVCGTGRESPTVIIPYLNKDGTMAQVGEGNKALQVHIECINMIIDSTGQVRVVQVPPEQKEKGETNGKKEETREEPGGLCNDDS